MQRRSGGGDRVDPNHVLWLVLIWVALIALWPLADRRRFGDLRRWVGAHLHSGHDADPTHPSR